MQNIDATKILTESELVSTILFEACKFIEFYTESHMYYYRFYGYRGPSPKRFHPGTGDKMILRELIEKRIKEIPEEYRIEHNIPPFAQRILFWDYYPAYDNLNRQNLE